jgi:hypothetical protein
VAPSPSFLENRVLVGILALELHSSPGAMAATNSRAFGFDIDYTEMVVR